MRKSNLIKLAISIIWDILDFTVGWIPVVGELLDMAGGFLATMLWGNLGVFAFWELINITDPIDAFIPSLTLIGLISVLREP